MQIFPESIRSLWVEWEIRVLVLLSLLMQIILIILGGRRKYSPNIFLNFTLWRLYLSADWIATMSLGNLASNQMGDSNNNNSDTSKNQQKLLLHALWAPFLLLHLGGPDTITAYSLEDNSLWLRHLLGLIVQVSGAFYIFLLSLGNNSLSLISIPVFVSGVIKYLERTLALRAANPDQMRNSKEDEEDIPDDCDDDDELKHVHLGYHILPFAKNLYANRKVFRSYYDRQLMSSDVFKVIEAQLGFLFDELYTKASIIYTPQGLVLRLISVLSIVSALVAFHFIVIIDNSTKVDAVITYILFVGAVSLEIYAFASLILSDWTIRWVTKMNTHCPFANSLYSAISGCRRRCRIMFHEKRWSGNMGQLNLVDICLKETEDIGTESSYRVSFEFFNLFRIKGETMVDNDLKSCVYTELVMKMMLTKWFLKEFNIWLKKLHLCMTNKLYLRIMCLKSMKV